MSWKSWISRGPRPGAEAAGANGSADTADTADTAPAPDAPGGDGGSASPLPPAEERFVDRGEIGQGGMGSVRRVRDLALMREVAVKHLEADPYGADRDRVLRFLEEAQITGQLDHPNIPPVHDLRRLDDGGHQISMKLVAGQTLERVIEEAGADRLRPERLAELLQVLVKVCEAVAFAHSRGVVHRDLKPANVMVGDFGQVYVMDWGVARIVEPEGGGPAVTLSPALAERDLDSPGTLVGTPNYMPPEQVQGRHRETDARSDVFALGATLYHLLTGRPPYRERNYYRLLLEALRCEPVPAEEAAAHGDVSPGTVTAVDPDGGTTSTATVTTTSHTVPAELARIAHRAMAPDPADRYPTVSDLRRDLERFLRGAWHLPTRTFPAGADVVTEGEEGDAAYLLVDGRCTVHKRAAGDEVELRRLGPGDVFGETAIFSAAPRTATVRALDDVTVTVVDRESLATGVGLDSWGGRFVRALADRFREVDDRLRRLEAASREGGKGDDEGA